MIKAPQKNLLARLYTGIVCEPTFRKDGLLEFLTVEKGILYRVTSKAFLPAP